VSLLGSAGCQPCSRRQLADDTPTLQKSFGDERSKAFRQAAENNRLAACAPQSFGCKVDLVEVLRRFALTLVHVARFQNHSN